MNVLRDSAHVWQLGNEPNLTGESGGWTNNQITPTAYAQIYQNVHSAMLANAVNAAPGAHRLLIAPPSPGDVVSGVRWISGNDWLGQTIDAFGANKSLIDGVAIHGYGGGNAQQSLIGFRNSIEVGLRSGKSVNAKSVLLFGLGDDLVHQLPGRAQKYDALIVLAAEPFPDQ